MARVQKRKAEAEGADINISPLIDMVFILLIFFIVATVFVDERGLRTESPEIGPDTGDGEPLTLRLTDSDRIFLNGRERSLLTLGADLRQERTGENVTVALELENRARVEATARVIDLCREAGLDRITLRLASGE